MSQTLAIDRFTRLKETVSGQFKPRDLPRLAGYLAGEGGEISYSLTGSAAADITGRQTKRLKCIISGWFLLADPLTLKPERHDLAIESRLVVVMDEADLPPLEEESENEDYIVCAAEMDIRDRIEEEILLDLPSNAVKMESAGAKSVKAQGVTPKQDKVSPFAKLVDLKKKV